MLPVWSNLKSECLGRSEIDCDLQYMPNNAITLTKVRPIFSAKRYSIGKKKILTENRKKIRLWQRRL